MLRRLSIFAGGWTLEAAESICGGEGITEPEVLELLMHLVQKSLVLFEGQGQEAWYKQLETVRQYAREKLLESGEAGVVRARHLDWYIKLAEQAEVQLQGPEQVIWLNRLKREYDNFRTALAWCKAEENGAETGLRLAGALWRSWEIHGHFSEGRKWLEDALAQGSSASKQVRAKALYGAGVLVGYHWAYRQAKVLFEESLALYREFGDKQGIARALGGLGGAIDGMDGKKELIIGLFEESLALCREIGDKKGIAMALESLATYMREKEYDNDYERAKTLYQESLALYRELGEKRGIAQLVNSLGWLTFYHYADFFPPDLEPAKALYEESLILFRELGDTGGIADSLTGLGWVAIHQSDYERATSLFTENLTLGRELGYTWLATVSLRGLGIVAQYQGNYQQAEALYQEQLAIVKKSENSTWTVTALGDLGSVALCQKKYEQAEALFREGLALNQKLGLDETVAAMILDCLGSVKRYQGNYQEATVIFEKNLALYRRKGIKWGIFSALCYLEVLARYQGDYERAEKLLKEALSQIREQKLSVVPHLVLPHLEVLAGVACAQRQHEHAAQFFGAADAVRQAIGRPLPPCDRTDYDRDVEVARTALSAEGFAAEWAKGRAMTLEHAVEYALEKLSQA
ncbi:tetratricopeptide repeat protein [Candidatus Acetothermia bacterium]|nr:tetratricopeptide repeat protein [Candidatus Acetothermia bacterium]